MVAVVVVVSTAARLAVLLLLPLLLLLSGCRPAPIGTETDNGGVGIRSGLQLPLVPVPRLVSSCVLGPRPA